MSRETPVAILYARLSKAEDDENGHGLAVQAERLDALATLHADDRPLLRITDDGETAANLNRPGMERALEMLTTGEADMLIVSKLDRLTRSVRDFGHLSEFFAECDCALVIGDPAVDTSKPSGRLVLNLMIAVAQWERETIADRTRQGLAAAKEKGVRLGARVQLPEDVRQRIAAERHDGATLRQIADGLMTDEVPTATGKAKWYASTVRATLDSIENDAAKLAAD